MKKWFLKGFLACFFFLSLCNVAYAADMITVKLSNFIGNKSVVSLVPSSNYIVQGTNISLVAGQTYQIKAENGVINIYKDTVLLVSKADVILSSSLTTSYVDLEGRKYLGQMTFKNESGYVRPYNYIEVETYLKGVVPVEMSDSWGNNGGLEALKAQAVAARTYVKENNFINQSFITDTQTHQVYGGYFPTYSKSNLAVDSTKGEIATYNQKAISAVFSSSNGGYIESNRGAWGGTLIGYLNAKTDPFDPINPFTYAISEATLIEKIKPQSDAKGIVVKSITSIKRNGFTDGQRTVNLTFNVITTAGTNATFDISTPMFRTLLGPSNIKSLFLNEPTKSTTTFTFTGKGYGHGVGMSQWGAYKMAQAGYTYRSILGFYYPSTQLFNGTTYTNLIY